MVDRSRFGKKVKKVKKPEHDSNKGNHLSGLLNYYISGNTTEFQCPIKGYYSIEKTSSITLLFFC